MTPTNSASPTPARFPDPTMVPTNGVELEVFDAGPSDGPAVVLCHGWPEHAYSWRNQVEPLADAGYHVIVPNQRGYGASSRPEDVEAYDIEHLTGDLAGLLDHFGHRDGVFIGHDWGAIVVWAMGQLRPERMRGLANLSVPFLERGETDWVSFWEQHIGDDFYIVHFNRRPGVADAAFDADPRRFLTNLYRTEQWLEPKQAAQPGMAMLNIATASEPRGKPLMSDAELDVFVQAFEVSGFTGGLNWYRNFTRNWHLLANAPTVIELPALMLYGEHDMVAAGKNLAEHVPGVEEHTLDCGHWIQQERPAETTAIILDWLARTGI